MINLENNPDIRLYWSNDWQAWILEDNCRKEGKLEQMFDDKKKAEYVYYNLRTWYRNHPREEW